MNSPSWVVVTRSFCVPGIIGGGQRRELALARGRPLINHHLSRVMDHGRVKNVTGIRQVQIEFGLPGNDVGTREHDMLHHHLRRFAGELRKAHGIQVAFDHQRVFSPHRSHY